jgi:pyridoxine 5'-phosphate synthase PdxJ
MTFPKNKNTINVDKLSEVINDNEMGMQLCETADMVITINKETPERITVIPSYVEDEWDNIHGDMTHFW